MENPIFAISVVLVAILVCLGLSSVLSPPKESTRYQTIDGLRGYLAIGVFIHHASYWPGLVTTGAWSAPSFQHIYTLAGQASVIFFFMITSFLFYSKLLNGSRGIDWKNFFRGRIFRLYPMYLLAVAGILLLVLLQSTDGKRDSALHITKGIASWLLFTVPGNSQFINGINTVPINAGVNWSLPYEWYFYFALPALAAVRGMRVPKPVLVMSAGCIALAAYVGASGYYAWVFLGGILAAYMVRNDKFNSFARSYVGSALLLVIVSGLVITSETALGYRRLLPLVFAFCLIACGADLFGLFRARFSLILGELSYSVYLLHGMMLFITMRYIVGFEVIKGISPLKYWMIIVASVPLLLIVSSLTYRFVELPCIRQGAKRRSPPVIEKSTAALPSTYDLQPAGLSEKEVQLMQ